MVLRRFTAVAAAVVIGCSSVQAQPASRVGFSRVTTEPGLGRLDFVLAVADLNGDGRDDILAGEREEFGADGAPEDRFEKTTLHVFVGEENGGLTPAPELVDGTIEVRSGVAVAADFNGDARADLAVFDAGVYVSEPSRLGYGNPPQMFLSSEDGRLRPSEALADAVRHEHEARPHSRYSGPADLHLKSATPGDIDGDGDIDLWVESTGGANVTSHFMVNNGDGTFTVDIARAPEELRAPLRRHAKHALSVDIARAPEELLHNPPPEYWRHVGAALVDLDNDRDLDLALGQIRDLDPTHINQFSIVLVNDGTGSYPARIELPHPAFNDGYTAVNALTRFDVDVPQRNADGEVLVNYAAPKMHDVDRDGCADLVVSGSHEEVGTDAPLVYRNNGGGRFEAMPPEPFGGSDDSHVGLYAVPADVNGDAVIDFVLPRRHDGPDGRPRTADDFGTLVTLVNTTPTGPVRCG